MAFFSSGINEFRNVVKSQAEFLFSAALTSRKRVLCSINGRPSFRSA